MQKTDIYFDKGTLVLKQAPKHVGNRLSGVKWDRRTLTYRPPAYAYREIVLELRTQKVAYQDYACQFIAEEFTLKEPITPRSYQLEAMDTWQDSGCRGVLPCPRVLAKPSSSSF